MLYTLTATACGGGQQSTAPQAEPNSIEGGVSFSTGDGTLQILPIDEQQAQTPTQIRGFTPTSGVVGDVIVIDGLFPEPERSQYSVFFNGVEVIEIDVTQQNIAATVPQSASTGPITVANQVSTFTTSQVFTLFEHSDTPGFSWITRMSGLGVAPTGILFDGEKTIAAGDTTLTSENLTDWRERETFSRINDIQWNGQMFVAATRFGGIAVSENAYNWRDAYDGHADLVAVAYSDSVWVVAGEEIVTSSDGNDWVSQELPESVNSVTDITWNGSNFIAVGTGGTILTSTNGYDWFRSASGTCSDFISIATQSDKAIASTKAGCDQSAAIYISSTGENWQRGTEFNSGSNPIDNLIVQDGLWSGSSGRSIVRSTDGVSWDRSTVGWTDITAHAYDGNRYLATDLRGDLYTSADGANWKVQATDTSWSAIAHNTNGQRSVLVSDRRSATSIDNGATWSFQTGRTRGFSDIAWSPWLNRFLAVESGGRTTYTSTDGLTWTDISSARIGGLVAASENIFINAPHQQQQGIAASTDGINWTLTNDTESDIQDLVWTGSEFLAVGHNGTVLISPNGIDWQDRSLPQGVSGFLKSAIASSDTLVAIGAFGSIFTSTDKGQSWTSTADAGSTTHLKSIAWTGSEFVVVGEDGIALHSEDGQSWATKPTQYNDVLFSAEPYHLNTILWTGTALIAAGTRGLIATSPTQPAR